MVEYEKGGIGKGDICKEIAKDMEEELREMYRISIQNKSEIGSIFYKRDGRWEKTDNIIGEHSLVPGEDIKEKIESIQGEYSHSALIHTHPGVSIELSVVDIYQSLRSTMFTMAGGADPLIDSTLVISRFPGTKDDTYLSLYGIEFKDSIDYDGVINSFGEISDIVDEMAEVRNRGEEANMQEYRIRAIEAVKEVAHECGTVIGRV